MFCGHSLYYNCFCMSWLVPMNRDDTKWLASTTLLLLHKPLSAQLGCVLHEVSLIAFMLYWMRQPFNYSMYLIPPESVCILLKVNFNCLYVVWVWYFYCWYFMSFWNHMCISLWKWILAIMRVLFFQWITNIKAVPYSSSNLSFKSLLYFAYSNNDI